MRFLKERPTKRDSTLERPRDDPEQKTSAARFGICPGAGEVLFVSRHRSTHTHTHPHTYQRHNAAELQREAGMLSFPQQSFAAQVRRYLQEAPRRKRRTCSTFCASSCPSSSFPGNICNMLHKYPGSLLHRASTNRACPEICTHRADRANTEMSTR